eukprot:3941920-Rhodomonas_salina.1
MWKNSTACGGPSALASRSGLGWMAGGTGPLVMAVLAHARSLCLTSLVFDSTVEVFLVCFGKARGLPRACAGARQRPDGQQNQKVVDQGPEQLPLSATWSRTLGQPRV